MSTSRDPFAPRPTDKPQLSREDIRGMHPLDVDQARREGRLEEAMRTPDPDWSENNPHKSRVSAGVQGRDWEQIVKGRNE